MMDTPIKHVMVIATIVLLMPKLIPWLAGALVLFGALWLWQSVSD